MRIAFFPLPPVGGGAKGAGKKDCVGRMHLGAGCRVDEGRGSQHAGIDAGGKGFGARKPSFTAGVSLLPGLRTVTYALVSCVLLSGVPVSGDELLSVEKGSRMIKDLETVADNNLLKKDRTLRRARAAYHTVDGITKKEEEDPELIKIVDDKALSLAENFPVMDQGGRSLQDQKGGQHIKRVLRTWFSEEGSGHSPLFNGPIQTVYCKGSLCDNMSLDGMNHLKHVMINDNPWSPSFSEENNGSYVCPKNYFVVRVKCAGTWCDNLSLKCAKFKHNSGYYLDHSSGFTTNWFSEEEGSATCGSKGAVVGMFCSGSHCDKKRLYCKLWGQVIGHLEPITFSKTSNRFQLTGWVCIKGYSQSVEVNIYSGGKKDSGGTNLGNFLAYHESGDWPAYKCDANYYKYRFFINKVIAEPGVKVFAYGVYSKNTNGHPLIVNGNGELKFPDFNTVYSGWFSEENSGLSRYFQGPIQTVYCTELYCDNMSLDGMNHLEQYMIDDISWSPDFGTTYTPKSYVCPKNYFVVRV
eukprot:CAMPEP_0184871700 /NCGR_PEP_ID=MMETSP0580-20130426/40869_1 /TAXON_ID=1118495 /ORGANISM="Dactyliosolen fragilissimus" /LENGTH=522 /DNA_ID=CAMNT_0027374395 /DNA_START=387 /DNA_END=1951 /DNA_ORIENTATION=-